eukprot:83234_1
MSSANSISSVSCSPDIASPTVPPTTDTQQCIEQSLSSKGYTPIKKVANALQGSVWETCKNETKYIVKVAAKSLHKEGITYINHQKIAIEEDIIKETEIIKYLTRHDPPSSFTKFIDFFDDTQYYYLVMEHGGHNLFDFVRKCHEYIAKDALDLSEWASFCKTAMQQMVSLVHWMHTKMKCCHLDISLENFVIDGLTIEILDGGDTQKRLRISHDFQIKIIDFGLAEVFTDDFKCRKHVGKTVYKSPEIYHKVKVFDARTADVWSLGVCLFMMAIGTTPFDRASMADQRFCLVMNGQMLSLLYSWDRMAYINSDILDLLDKIFMMEPYRITIQQIQNHAYLTSSS